MFFPPWESAESCRPDLQSVVIKTNRIITQEKFNEFIQSVKTDFIRCKGFVCTGTKEKVLVQGIFDDYSVSPVGWFPGPTELVGIGILHDNLNYTEVFEKLCIV